MPIDPSNVTLVIQYLILTYTVFYTLTWENTALLYFFLFDLKYFESLFVLVYSQITSEENILCHNMKWKKKKFVMVEKAFIILFISYACVVVYSTINNVFQVLINTGNVSLLLILMMKFFCTQF